MQHHIECLRVLCRLCGKDRAVPLGRHPIKKEQLAHIIKAALALDMSDDVGELHPPFVCKPCEVMLRKWWGKHQKRKKASCNIHLRMFTEKICEKCMGVSDEVMSSRFLNEWAVDASNYGLIAWQGSDKLHIMKMGAAGQPVIYFTICSDLSWHLLIAGVTVHRSRHKIFSDVAEKLDSASVHGLFQKITTFSTCEGNGCADFPVLVEKRKGPEGQIPVRITAHDVLIGETIRHIHCQLLQSDQTTRCQICKVHRGDLMSMTSQERSKKSLAVSIDSPIPNIRLTTRQLHEKVSLLQKERRNLKRRGVVLQEKISSMINQEAVLVTDLQDGELKAALNQCDVELTDTLVKDSPAFLLWKQQKESTLKGKQMRWHPAVIRWCIALQSKFTAAYNLMRQSGFLKLPHPGTLHSYTHFANPTTGFNAAMLDRVARDNKISTCPDHERNVSVLFDEMKIKAGLVFSVRSGKVVGFTDIGSIANEVADFERRCRGETEPPVASHVLVLMVRGIFSSLHAVVGYYPSTGVTSDQLYPCLWEAIVCLEAAGFIVRSLVSDGASPNRKFYRLHSKETTTEPTYFTANPCDPDRQVFFICDVPHLMKTTRNNWENSGYHNKTKTLSVSFNFFNINKSATKVFN